MQEITIRRKSAKVGSRKKQEIKKKQATQKIWKNPKMKDIKKKVGIQIKQEIRKKKRKLEYVGNYNKKEIGKSRISEKVGNKKEVGNPKNQEIAKSRKLQNFEKSCSL